MKHKNISNLCIFKTAAFNARENHNLVAATNVTFYFLKLLQINQ